MDAPHDHGELLVTAWQDALCAQVGGDLWFPEKGGSNTAAKRICAACPVRAECLQYALDNDIRFGIFGGLSGYERRKLTKTRVPRPDAAAVGTANRRHVRVLLAERDPALARNLSNAVRTRREHAPDCPHREARAGLAVPSVPATGRIPWKERTS